MPLRFIIVVVCLAIALAGAVLWMGKGAAPTAPAEPILGGIDPLKVNRIDVAWSADGSLAAQVVRDASGTWIMKWTAGASEGTWPVISSRVAGAVRLLSQVRASAGGSADLMGEPVAVTVHAGGVGIAMRAARRSFGGRGILVREMDLGQPPMIADVDAELVQVFGRADVLAWRDMSVFPAEVADAGRIQMDSPGGAEGAAASARLSRAGSRWGIMAPAIAPADKVQVDGLLAALKQLRIVRVADDATLNWSRVPDDQLKGRIVIETDRRVPDGDAASRWVLRQELRLGPPTGASDEQVMGSAEMAIVRADGRVEPLWGPTPLVLDAATARSVVRPAEAMIDRHATGVVAADIRGMRIGVEESGIEVRRSLDVWNRGDGSELTLIQREAVRTIIELLTMRSADRVEFVDAGDAKGERVALMGVDGPPLDEVFVSRRMRGEQEEMLIASGRGGRVVRVYGVDTAGTWVEAVERLRK
ncbi:MAG: hypothetical protein IT435_06155 [Phycisphaerales bacterium]|nr:hypothetical protein [Phycisphaerales bacterium]